MQKSMRKLEGTCTNLRPLSLPSALSEALEEESGISEHQDMFRNMMTLHLSIYAVYAIEKGAIDLFMLN